MFGDLPASGPSLGQSDSSPFHPPKPHHHKFTPEILLRNSTLGHGEKVVRPFCAGGACLDPCGRPDAKLEPDPVGFSSVRTQPMAGVKRMGNSHSCPHQKKTLTSCSFISVPTPWLSWYQAKLPSSLWVQARSFFDTHSSKGSFILLYGPLSTDFRRDTRRGAEK